MAAGLLAGTTFREVRGYREFGELARKSNPHWTPQRQMA